MSLTPEQKAVEMTKAKEELQELHTALAKIGDLIEVKRGELNDMVQFYQEKSAKFRKHSQDLAHVAASAARAAYFQADLPEQKEMYNQALKLFTKFRKMTIKSGSAWDHIKCKGVHLKVNKSTGFVCRDKKNAAPLYHITEAAAFADLELDI